MDVLHTLDGAAVEAVPAAWSLVPYATYTSCVVVERAVLGWSGHLARLAGGVDALWGHPLDPDDVRAAVAAHLALLPDPDAARALRVTAHPADLDLLDPAAATGVRLLVSSRPAAFPPAVTDTFTVGTVAHIRELAGVKSTSLLEQVRLRREARLAGHDDALFVTGEQVLEGSTWTVLVWRGDDVVTPAGPVLPSTTAGHLGAIAVAAGGTATQAEVTLADLHGADLVMAVNVNTPARAISAVDGRRLPLDRDRLDGLAAAYAALPREPVAPA